MGFVGGGAPGFPGPGPGQPPGLPGSGGFQPPMGGILGGPPGGFPGRADYKELIPVLVETLGDADADVRKNVAHSLARIGQSSVAPLLDILKDKDKSKELKANAAYILGKIGPPAREALPTLTKALKDHDRELRRRAAFAIANIVGDDWGGGFPPGMFPGAMRGGMGMQSGRPDTTGTADPGLLVPTGIKPEEKEKKDSDKSK
jgi:hypothetical protein